LHIGELLGGSVADELGATRLEKAVGEKRVLVSGSSVREPVSRLAGERSVGK